MKSIYKKGALASQIFLILSGVSLNVNATAPVEFDAWTQDSSSGIITTVCPTGYKCEQIVSQKGYIQQRLRETNADGSLKRGGKVFYRTIIAEKDIKNESYVQVHEVIGTNHPIDKNDYLRHGLASKQSIGSDQTTLNAQTEFSSDTTIYTGWASQAGVADLQINQSVNEVSRKAGVGGVYLEGNFTSLASINANYDESGKRTGLAMGIEQSMDEPGQYGLDRESHDGKECQDSPSSGCGYNEIDSQVFSLRGLEGDMLTAAGSLTADGDTISWAAGDKLWGHVVGQNFHHTTLTGNGGGLKGFGDDSDRYQPGFEDLGMMFEQYDNRSDSQGAVNYFAYFENDTKSWPTVFGAEPVLPLATGANGSGYNEMTTAPTGPAPTLVSGLFTPTPVGPAQADGRDAPIAFGQWDVVGGTLTAEGVLADPIVLTEGVAQTYDGIMLEGDGSVMPECSADPSITCENTEVIAPGMIQRVVTDASGQRYIQTILTDLEGGFSSESFVSMADTLMLGVYGRDGTEYSGGTVGPRESGIALRQVMDDDYAFIGQSGNVRSEVEIKTGWAAKADVPNIKILQDVTSTGPKTSSFDQFFAYSGNRDAEGNSLGAEVDVYQRAINTAAAYNSKYSRMSDVQDKMVFAHRSRSGNLQNTSGSARKDSKSDGPSSINWDAGDAITANWIYLEFGGNSVDKDTDGFGVVLYDNLADAWGYVDVGFEHKGYNGLGSDWLASSFGTEPSMSTTSDFGK